jgi:hypothetical protein
MKEERPDRVSHDAHGIKRPADLGQRRADLHERRRGMQLQPEKGVRTNFRGRFNISSVMGAGK